ncbi:MAG: MBL fold metallo-hydrolase [Parvularculaceae bacterium]|nr:MBL fold metallo-hydrolase [Parvularculaceae bacterium]
MRIIALPFAIAAHIGAAYAHDPARAVYVANAGVLVARGQTKILIDAFYAYSYDTYLTPPTAIEDAMMRGEAPYDGVDAVFVSHIHGDHFSPAPMLDYLRAQPAVRLFAPTQVVDALEEAGMEDGLRSRIVPVDIGPEDNARSLHFGDVEIDVVSLPHAGNRPEVQNYSWRVTLDDETTIIHFGDAGSVEENFARHSKHFSAREHDAAFPPYWWYDEPSGRGILENYVKAKQVIGVHIPASALGRGDETRRDLGGDVFTDPGEERVISE